MLPGSSAQQRYREGEGEERVAAWRQGVAAMPCRLALLHYGSCGALAALYKSSAPKNTLSSDLSADSCRTLSIEALQRK